MSKTAYKISRHNSKYSQSYKHSGICLFFVQEKNISDTVIIHPFKARARRPAQSSGFPYVNYNREFQKIFCLPPRLGIGGT